VLRDSGRAYRTKLKRSASRRLIRFVEHRVGDRRVIRLIRKWLKAGVMEGGEVTRTEVGTPQGGVAPSPFQHSTPC
jgi:retron-type reverse transcriptase